LNAVSLGRLLRAVLMVLFLIPGLQSLWMIPTDFLLVFLMFFVFSLMFWVVESWLASGPLVRPLIFLSLKAEGTSRGSIPRGTSKLPSLMYQVGGKGEKADRNRCLLLSKKYTAKPRGPIDMLERAFFPTSLVIGIVSGYLLAFDILGISGLLEPTHPTLMLIYALSPGLVSLIVVPIWLVNDTRARIIHARTGEIKRIGESLKTVINSIAGFGALFRLATALWIAPIVWTWVFFTIPLPILLTTTIYLQLLHRKRVEHVEEAF